MELRDYQATARAEVRAAWSRRIRRPAVILPTGAGKTVVFSAIAAEMAELGIVSLILAHRDELIEQAADKQRRYAPHLRVGIVKGPREEIRGRHVIVGSVQTLGRKDAAGQRRRLALKRAGVRLVIVDEAHHAVSDSYMIILRDLGCFDEVPTDGALTGAYALGVTATMSRTDRVALGQVWEEVVYRRSIVEMIRAGHLVNAKGIRVRVAGLDLSRVKRSGGDYQGRDLSEALHESLAPAAVARAYVEHAAGRQAVLFSPDVAMAYEMAEALVAVGVRAVAFDGKTPTEERRRILKSFEAGEIDVVCNCAVLTEGFDAPWCSCVIIARPTSSQGLYVQMAGRGLRPYPGKSDCLIIDVVGVTGRHRLAGLADLGGADRVEKLDDDLSMYDGIPDDEEIDLLGLLDPEPKPAPSSPWGADGPLVVEVVDLFGESRHTWLQTARGVWFLEAPGERVVFLVPEPAPGRYAVCSSGYQNASGEYLYRNLEIGEAMLRGEHVATEVMGGVLTRRTARWRLSAPTSGQIARAARLGLDTEGKTKGDLSDEIAVSKASARIDGMLLVAPVTRDGYWPKAS